MQLRILRIIGFAVLGSTLAGLCIIGLAVAVVTCYDYPFTTRDQLPAVLGVPRQEDTRTEVITFPLPIVSDPLISTDQHILETDRSNVDVLAFYQQHLVATGWEDTYVVNPRTNQMFILNKQACPYYGLRITIIAIGSGQTRVTLDPYVEDTCDCN
jgi:hypothetical protein